MTRYAIKLEYIGKNYCGSQKQPEGKTVQNVLEDALCTLTKTKIKTIFSGRTDKGVNSKGQIVHFDFDEPIVASRFINSMNGILPDDISISELKPVQDDFHAQRWAKKRYYQYRFINRQQRSVFDNDLMLVRYDCDIKRMRKTLEYLLGEHDFTSFCGADSEVPSNVCFIYSIDCKKVDDTIILDIVGNRFLCNMVRIIVGTLLLIEKNKLPCETISKILEAKDRKKAGQTVSPYGLTLMKVEY
ncbi:tRNA pseudouridine(38-40) synthase TruA [bacterium]|nr:tRNA pseudouridine(38-40) synthase TruA [bacterium]